MILITPPSSSFQNVNNVSSFGQNEEIRSRNSSIETRKIRGKGNQNKIKIRTYYRKALL